MTDEQRKLLDEATGGLHEYSISEKNENIVVDIMNRLASTKNDKEDYFHNARYIWFKNSPLNGFNEFLRITDIMIIADEIIHYLQSEKIL